MSIKIGNTTLAKSSTFHPDLFDVKWSDHILNNMSWLRADTFSWHYGSMYQKAYQHLSSDLAQQGVITYYGWEYTDGVVSNWIYTTTISPAEGDQIYTLSNGDFIPAYLIDSTMEATPLYIRTGSGIDQIYTRNDHGDTRVKATQEETIANITIKFFQAEDGHKIVDASQIEKVNQIYSATGLAWYYVVDTQNKRFKLPRKRSYELVRNVNYGDKWYRLYADGWCEQGGTYTGSTDGWVTTTLPLTMRDTGYQVTINRVRKSDTGDPGSGGIDRRCFMTNGYTQTSFKHWGIWASYPCTWRVEGQSNKDPSTWSANEKYMYMYVGDASQTALENTAGLNASLFTTKLDRDLQNIDPSIDFVIESVEPTVANNYTWYRKYRSGWVEQGGEMKNANSSGTALITINMPIEMANTHYTCLLGARYDGTDADKFGQTRQSWTTTSFTVYMTTVAYGTNYQYGWWYVSGKAA